MIVPSNYEELTDEELKESLLRHYDSDAADYVIDILRGRIEAEGGID